MLKANQEKQKEFNANLRSNFLDKKTFSSDSLALNNAVLENDNGISLRDNIKMQLESRNKEKYNTISNVLDGFNTKIVFNVGIKDDTIASSEQF